VHGSGQCDQEDVTDTQQGQWVPQAEVPLEVPIQEQMLLQWGELILQYKAPQLSQDFTEDASSLQS